jgi:hypothetical protein
MAPPPCCAAHAVRFARRQHRTPAARFADTSCTEQRTGRSVFKGLLLAQLKIEQGRITRPEITPISQKQSVRLRFA